MRLSTLLLFIALCFPCYAAQKIGSVARVKGQEPTVIHGFGLVAGLKGTGDKPGEFKETARSLLRMLELTGHPNVTEKELASSKNVALVAVTATIPGEGARDGDLIQCTVKSVGSSPSLKDGELLITDLVGPVPQSPEQTRTLAKAWGPLTLETTETPTIAKVTNGARMTANFRNPYILDGCITLVLPQKYATFSMATAIVEAINTSDYAEDANMAHAHDQQSISVKIPYQYIKDPVPFVSEIMNLELIGVQRIPMVAINERTGLISIDEDVEIAPVAISHKNNLSIQTGGTPAPQPGQQAPPPPQRFLPLDVEGRMNKQENIKLKALCDALNEMKVPTSDIIAIIQLIDRQGNLYGKIEYER